jgi:hypothetical protein
MSDSQKIPSTEKPKQEVSVLKKSINRALGGGIAGSAAMVIQVSSLMWLRTTMNYQYRYGKSTKEALSKLYSEGGIRRFYRGIGPALAMGPLSRFGDTAANAFMLEFLKDKNLNTGIKTMCGSFAAALWRICLMPIDALKTNLQVEGKNGIKILFAKIKKGGPQVLYYGTGANVTATFVGHYPWFLINNLLKKYIPNYQGYKQLIRNAGIGFICAVVSDTCSNSLRVIKTTKQTYSEPIGYAKVVKVVVDKDGYMGLFGRGLKTRILTNGLQGIIFNVFWNIFQDLWFGKDSSKRRS